MKFLKFLVIFLTIFGSSVFVYGYLDKTEVIDNLIEYYKKEPSKLVANEYKKDINLDFVKLTDDFIANDKDELLNIYYTVISSGMNEFTFYCDSDYVECPSDIKALNNDSELLSYINNFVHVYNGFKSIKTTYTNMGKITLYINKIYSEEDIKNINKEIDIIYDDIIDINKSEYDNIKSIHDYIINETKYDKESENKKSNPDSSNAKGVFFNKLATCNGYTDAASLLLDKYGIKNTRISSNDHIWNIVYTNNEWLHLDLTWDDPINDFNQDLLSYDYFLKDTENLDKKSTSQENRHIFNRKIYNFVK